MAVCVLYARRDLQKTGQTTGEIHLIGIARRKQQKQHDSLKSSMMLTSAHSRAIVPRLRMRVGCKLR